MGRIYTLGYVTQDFALNLRGTNPKPEFLCEIHNHMTVECTESSMTLREFMEAELGFYKKGWGYYQLTKRETVQAGKVIAVKHDVSGRVFAGNFVRKCLGLPDDDVPIIVEPFYTGDYTIFIQSNSPARKVYKRNKILFVLGD